MSCVLACVLVCAQTDFRRFSGMLHIPASAQQKAMDYISALEQVWSHSATAV
ncbi:hypothetical protein T11_13520 [Trichinella zimbabwensis]|uniref:Uncharacterized protein n=1 Tax=Trichinella zimbabwensis TaxID=268475 RepID=A0A0V1I042_9BILA|nr:hypothetical protein T11_13520 [Trichinella zimbabwensis]